MRTGATTTANVETFLPADTASSVAPAEEPVGPSEPPRTHPDAQDQQNQQTANGQKLATWRSGGAHSSIRSAAGLLAISNGTVRAAARTG